MPDSWIIIIITTLIIFLIFYMSNRIIFWNKPAQDSWQSNETDSRGTSISYIANESIPNSPRIVSSDKILNYNTSEMNIVESRVENQLRSQMFQLMLAQKEYNQLEMDVRRLAQVLSLTQGVSTDDCMTKLKSELSPLLALTSFQAHRQNYSRLSNYLKTGVATGEAQSANHYQRIEDTKIDSLA